MRSDRKWGRHTAGGHDREGEQHAHPKEVLPHRVRSCLRLRPRRCPPPLDPDIDVAIGFGSGDLDGGASGLYATRGGVALNLVRLALGTVEARLS